MERLDSLFKRHPIPGKLNRTEAKNEAGVTLQAFTDAIEKRQQDRESVSLSTLDTLATQAYLASRALGTRRNRSPQRNAAAIIADLIDSLHSERGIPSGGRAGTTEAGLEEYGIHELRGWFNRLAGRKDDHQRRLR